VYFNNLLRDFKQKMSISMFGESSHHQCSDTQSSHVPKRLKVSFVASSVSSAGSYSIATSGEIDVANLIVL
jgi:hypothetical protein